MACVQRHTVYLVSYIVLSPEGAAARLRAPQAGVPLHSNTPCCVLQTRRPRRDPPPMHCTVCLQCPSTCVAAQHCPCPALYVAASLV
jgi:hypothetical protein